jgi:hypothetical protein
VTEKLERDPGASGGRYGGFSLRRFRLRHLRVKVFSAVFDGAEYWLADRFHRLIATQELGLAEISVDLHPAVRAAAVTMAPLLDFSDLVLIV